MINVIRISLLDVLVCPTEKSVLRETLLSRDVAKSNDLGKYHQENTCGRIHRQ